MAGLRSIALVSVIGVAVLAPRARPADKDEASWEAVSLGAAKLAIPKGWRSLDKIKPNMPLFRQGDGLGVPALDETKSPLQIALIVEKSPGSKASVKEVMDGLVEAAKKAPRLELVGGETVEAVKLTDGTEALLLKAEFIKEGARRSFQMKLVAKDADANVWTVTGYVVGGKESKWPTADSDLSRWLAAHVTSLALDEKKFDADRITAAYKKRDKK